MITLPNYGYPLTPTTHNHSPSSLQPKPTPKTRRVFWSFPATHFGEKKMGYWEHLKMGDKIAQFSPVDIRPNVCSKVVVFSSAGIRANVMWKVERTSVIKGGNLEMSNKVRMFSSVGIRSNVSHKVDKMGYKVIGFSSVGTRPKVLLEVGRINAVKSGNLEMGNKVDMFSSVGTIRSKVLQKFERENILKSGNLEMGNKVEMFSSVGIRPKVLQKFERENILKCGNLEMGLGEMGLDDVEDEEEIDGPRKRFREKGVEKDYDRDPEFADILGSCLDDPQKAQSKMEDRLKKKKDKILHTKTGSGSPMKVTFNKFDFSNSYIWFEFYNPPLEKDISLICDTIRSWHIIGRLGGCNSMNMQLSQAPLDKRPSYDAIQGANVEPATFYNIGDFEIQENLARIWVDIGTTEPLLLDVLLNALTQISSDFVGLKQVIFGGSENDNWKEGMTSEDVGYSVHKI